MFTKGTGPQEICLACLPVKLLREVPIYCLCCRRPRLCEAAVCYECMARHLTAHTSRRAASVASSAVRNPSSCAIGITSDLLVSTACSRPTSGQCGSSCRYVRTACVVSSGCDAPLIGDVCTSSGVSNRSRNHATMGSQVACCITTRPSGES